MGMSELDKELLLNLEHIESMGCWCSPRRDEKEPSVIIHNDNKITPEEERDALKIALDKKLG